MNNYKIDRVYLYWYSLFILAQFIYIGTVYLYFGLLSQAILVCGFNILNSLSAVFGACKPKSPISGCNLLKGVTLVVIWLLGLSCIVTTFPKPRL